MGRKADSPTPKWSDERGCWTVRVTLPRPIHLKPGQPSPRRLVQLVADPPIAQDDEARAERFARLVVRGVRQGGPVPDENRETVAAYAARWVKARTGRVASIRDNEAHLEVHILPVIGSCAMADVTPALIERVVSALDGKVRAGELSAKTARNIWGTCSKLFADAAHAKPGEGLRCLAKDPSDGVRGPDDDDPDKALQFLYPSEFLAFVSHPEVPLTWRRNVAIAVYLCLRDGEQRALKWPAVDLVHGVVTVQETYDRRSGEDREGTKGGAVRVVPIRAELLPLLAAMKQESGGQGAVSPLPSLRDMARGLRRWLKRAGVDRAQLYDATSVSKNLRWHDTRATGLTWLAVEGRAPTEIRDIAGHTQTSQTDRYMRAAGVLRGGRFGDVFPPLPADLCRPRTGAECSDLATTADGDEQADDEDPAESPMIGSILSRTSEQSAPSSSPVRPAELPKILKNSGSEKPLQSQNPEPPAEADLEGAIAVLTRALASAADEDIPALVAERRAMRDELRALRETAAGVVSITRGR